MTIQATLSGQPVLNPATEGAGIAARGVTVPADFAKANCLINPLGREWARGWLLLRREALNALNLNGLHTLVINDGQGNQLSIGNLVITREPICLTPGNVLGDRLGAFLVEVADARWRVSNPFYCVPAQKQYNVRAPAFAAATDATVYYSSSLTGGVAWTWLGVVQDLWGLMTTQLGSAPSSLPFVPSGTPEGWIFTNTSAWEALCDVLDATGNVVTWNPVAGTYTLAQKTQANTTADAILAQAEAKGRKIHDAEPIAVVRGKVPAKVRVCFHRQQLWAGSEESATNTSSQWVSTPIYTVDVTGPETSVESGTYAVLWDDMPALYDSTGAITNAAACSTRATERANDFYSSLRGSVGTKLQKLYSGLVNVTPGSSIKGVAWRQDADGAWITEVIRVPTELVLNPSGSLAVAFGEDDCNTKIQAPRLSPTFANWPPLVQVLRINNGTPSGGLYDCTVERNDSPTAPTWTTRESIYGIDLASAASLTANDRYLGRLLSFSGTRPVYAFRSATGGGGGGTPAGSNTELQYNNAGAFGGATNVTFTAAGQLTHTIAGLGTGTNAAVIVTNTTAAAAGAQQYSPGIRLTGQGWKTAATAASQAVDWLVQNFPVQGSSAPTSVLTFLVQINGGGYSTKFEMTSAGKLVCSQVAATSVDATSFTIGSASINTAGTLSNVAYLNQANNFSANQTAPNMTVTSTLSVGATINASTAALTINSVQLTSGTPGAVFFTGASNDLISDSNLFWDNANNRLGIGTSTPGYYQHLYSTDNGVDAYFVLETTANSSTLGIYNSGTGGRNYELQSSNDGNSLGGGNFFVYDRTAGEVRMLIDSGGSMHLYDGAINLYSGLTIHGGTTGSTTFVAPEDGDDITYILPDADGSPGDALRTDGSGNLYWG